MKKNFGLYALLVVMAFVAIILQIESGADTWRALVFPLLYIAIGAISWHFKIWVVQGPPPRVKE